MSDDRQLRLAAMQTLDALVDRKGRYLKREELRNVLSGVDTPHLVDRQKGIWNPSWLDSTLSVLTMPEHSYDDRELAEGVWAYSYRKGGSGGDNTKLRRAWETKADIIYFRPVSAGRFEAFYPVRVVENHPELSEVVLVQRDIDRVDWRLGDEAEQVYLRDWSERVVLARKHQADFRKRVMAAYSHRCAMCNFGHASLVDAAHIDSDRSEFGDPHVNNGLALCKIHHGAYDGHLLTVTPELLIEVAPKVLREKDGPVLRYGIQALDGEPIRLPRRLDERPLATRLERRYELFRTASSR